MKINDTDKPDRLNNALGFFTKNPTQVFALALLLLFFVFAVMSIAAYYNYLADLKIVDIFPSLVTTAAILFSALWASTFVVQNMSFARETAKLQETLTLIRTAELDSEFLAARNVWSKYRAREHYDQDFASLMAAFLLDIKDLKNQGIYPSDSSSDANSNAKSQDEEDLIRKDALLLITYFNFFELSSISIDKEIMHEEFFRDWYATNFIRVWNVSIHAISALRKLHSNNRLYVAWELRSRQWAGELDLRLRETPEYNIKDLVKIAKKWRP